MTTEVFAGIKVLVALAQADGVVHHAERLAIENALDGTVLPEATTVSELLRGRVDVDLELSRIRSPEARERTLEAARAMAYVDGELSPAEDLLLAQIAAGLGFAGVARDSDRAGYTCATPPSLATRVDNTRQREVSCRSEIVDAAVFSAVLAAARLPIAAESCLFTNNVRLARNIGALHGHDVSDAFWRTFTQNLIGAEAPWFAFSSLLKLIPGSSQAGYAAYAATYALGQVTRLYFDGGEGMSAVAMRSAFLVAKEDGLAAAHDALAVIARRGLQLERLRAPLDAGLAAGTMTRTRYADELVMLAEVSPRLLKPVC